MSLAASTFAVQGPLLLTPRVFGDARGFFFESWNQRQWAELLAEHGCVPWSGVKAEACDLTEISDQAAAASAAVS